MNYAPYALATLLGFGAAACQKTDTAPTTIIGEWHWVSSTGGITGKQTYTPASTGSTDTWVFKSDSTYQRYTIQQGGTSVTDTGIFSFGSLKSIHTGKAARALTLRGKQPQTFLLEELTTRLVVSDNSYDGFGHTYER